MAFSDVELNRQRLVRQDSASLTLMIYAASRVGNPVGLSIAMMEQYVEQYPAQAIRTDIQIQNLRFSLLALYQQYLLAC